MTIPPPETDEELLRRTREVVVALVYEYLVEVRKQDGAEAQEVAMATGEKAAKAALAEMKWWND